MNSDKEIQDFINKAWERVYEKNKDVFRACCQDIHEGNLPKVKVEWDDETNDIKITKE